MESILRHTIPFRPIIPILTKTHEILSNQQTSDIAANNCATGVDFTPHVFLNGVTTDNLPTDDKWSMAYKDDNDCCLMMEMLNNPGLIDHANLKNYIMYSEDL